MAIVTRLLNTLASTSHAGELVSAVSYGMLAGVIHVLDASRRRDRLPAGPPAGNGARIQSLQPREPHQQIIVLSNREPCIHEIAPSGEIVARRSAGGLVTALEPVVRQYGGVWVAHGSGSADRLVSDQEGRIKIASASSSYRLRRVWLSPQEERDYYCGFANEGLWPLCHRAFAPPIFRRADWAAYQTVNRRFAEAVVAEMQGDRPIVLVQDYHFALVPGQLRDLRPDAVTIAFWHIPWPHAEQFALCPSARHLVAGLLGSDIVGFQTESHCEHFLHSVEAVGEWTVNRHSRQVVRKDGRVVQVRAYPISVEWPSPWIAETPSVEECRRQIRAQCGIDEQATLVLSVDRLDYTKGFDERLAAIEQLLETHDQRSHRLAFLQIAAPTRTGIERYGELASRVRARIARINQRFEARGSVPVTYLERYTDPIDVFRCYRAADVCYVGSLDDGMNLVAKEFVAARDDEGGALVLSQFAGAAQELTDALIVNPYDVDGVAEALAEAVGLSRLQQQSRMRALRRQIAKHNIHHWATAMLSDAEGLRRARPGIPNDCYRFASSL